MLAGGVDASGMMDVTLSADAGLRPITDAATKMLAGADASDQAVESRAVTYVLQARYQLRRHSHHVLRCSSDRIFRERNSLAICKQFRPWASGFSGSPPCWTISQIKDAREITFGG